MPSAAAPTGQLAAFLAAIRAHESGGSYSAANPSGGASGAYQFIQPTWDSWAAQAGYPQYVGQPASAAPPQVQDAVAAAMANSYYQTYGGNWQNVAEAWYYPAWAGNPAYQNSVPDPAAGNTLTVGEYGSGVVSTMSQILKSPNAALTSASGGILGAIGTAVGSVVGGPGVAGAAATVGNVFSPSSWERILLVVVFVGAGLGLIALGLARMFPGVAHSITSTIPIPV